MVTVFDEAFDELASFVFSIIVRFVPDGDMPSLLVQQVSKDQIEN